MIATLLAVIVYRRKQSEILKNNIVCARARGLWTSHMSFNSKENGKRIPKLTVSWEGIIPEFPFFLILPLFMTATLPVVIVYIKTRKKQTLFPSFFYSLEQTIKEPVECM